MGHNKISVSMSYNFIIVFVGSILAILFVTTLPFIFIYRILIVMCGKFLRPELQTIAFGLDMIFAKDFEFWDTKPENIMVLTVTLKSSFSYEKVYTLLKGIVAEKKYVRLCQYIVPWMGFGFWKLETPFSLENHICVFKSSEVQNDEWLNDFIKTMQNKSFGKMQSPWDITILPNYQPTAGSYTESSAVIFRFHHSLMDGHSFFKMLSSALDNYIPINPENRNNKKIGYSKVKYMTAWLLSPYTIIKFYLEDTNLTFKDKNTNYTGEISAAKVKTPIDKILLLRKKYNVGVDTIIFSGVTTVLKNILLRKKSVIPKQIRVGFPFPMKNHPDYLCNHYALTSLALPVGINDPVEGLVSINSGFHKIRCSEKPDIADIFYEILGRMPYRIIQSAPTVPIFGLISVFPLGAQKEFLGCTIDEYQASFTVPITDLDSGIAIFGAINNGYLFLRGTFDKSVVASDELAFELMNDIDRYFDILLKC